MIWLVFVGGFLLGATLMLLAVVAYAFGDDPAKRDLYYTRYD